MKLKKLKIRKKRENVLSDPILCLNKKVEKV